MNSAVSKRTGVVCFFFFFLFPLLVCFTDASSQPAFVVVGTECKASKSGRGKMLANRVTVKAKTDGEGSSSISDWFRTAIESTEPIATHNTIATLNKKHHRFSSIQTKFVLVGTKHPGNVGSTARALKTMGFFPKGLVVVDPHDPRVLGRKKCIDASSGARDVLDHAVVWLDDRPTKHDDDKIDEESDRPSLLRKAVEEAFRSSSESDGGGGEKKMDGESDREDNIPILICGTGMPVDMGQERISQRYLEPRKFFQSLLGEDGGKAARGSSVLRIAFVFGNERYGMDPRDIAVCDAVLGIPTHPKFGSLNLATAVQLIAYDWRQAMGGNYCDEEQ